MDKRGITGRTGEDKAADYLKKNGYRIISKNFRCRTGEIDIIATRMSELHFIEVKTRKSMVYGVPAEAVTYKKRQHILLSARYYLMRNPEFAGYTIMMDVIEIILKGEKGYVRFTENAFCD